MRGPLDELLHPVLSLVAERNQALAVALADDPQNALVQVDLAQLKIINSETRTPVAYSTSSIARSR